MPREWSREKVTGWMLLIVFVPIGGWLAWEIERTIGLKSPRLWELLKTDRVFDLAMLDFAMTASWGFMVLSERGDLRSWKTWVSLAVFCVVPTLGIALALILGKSSNRVEPATIIAD